MYKLEFVPRAAKEFKKLTRAVFKLTDERIVALKTNPFPSGYKNIQDHPGYYYRIRIVNYRVVYHVAEEVKIITIRKIGHRKDVYSRF